MKARTKPANARNFITSLTQQIGELKSLQSTICLFSFLICIFCGIEGGYQLHLSHEHSALSCMKLGMPVPFVPGDQIVPMADPIGAPVCKEPDELGQPWRLQLVLLNMLGFVLFGTLGLHESKQLLFADAPSE